MSNFLGRLVERASGPPAVGLSPRLAPVFPIGQADKRQADTEPFPAETSAALPATDVERTPPAPTPEIALPPADPPERSVTVTPSPASRELRELRIEHSPPEPLRTEIRKHERTLERSTVQREVEPAQPPKAPALATPRLSPVPVAAASRNREPRRQQPRIEVRIGRVEVRRAPDPEPFEWQAPAADPPAATGFGALAASRRYVDRRWS